MIIQIKAGAIKHTAQIKVVTIQNTRIIEPITDATINPATINPKKIAVQQMQGEAMMIIREATKHALMHFSIMNRDPKQHIADNISILTYRIETWKKYIYFTYPYLI
jgi:hypothetical protein